MLIANFYRSPDDRRPAASVLAAQADRVESNALHYGEGTEVRAQLEARAKELRRIAFMERARAGEAARG